MARSKADGEHGAAMRTGVIRSTRQVPWANLAQGGDDDAGLGYPRRSKRRSR